MKFHYYKSLLSLAVTSLLVAPAVQAAVQQSFTAPVELSNQVPDLDIAAKPKLVRLSTGILVMTYADGVNVANTVYDLKGDTDRPARDVFVRTCDSLNVDCADEANWTAHVNLSGTANLSSVNTDWDGDTDMDNTRKTAWGDY